MIVVTGAAGFIGSCVLSRLNSVGENDLLIVDHLNSQKELNLKGKKFSRYLEKQDFLDEIRGDKIKSKVEAVIHMGACSSTTLNDPQYFRENNFEYSCHVARWALQKNARLIYASSAATYGDGELGYQDDDQTTQKLKPLNQYGESKQNFDLWVLDQKLVGRIVGMKFFNVFGPNEYHKGDMMSVIAKAFEKVVQEGRISLFKSYRPEYQDGEQKRDFIYVKDAVDMVMFFWKHPEVNGIYNAGSGQAHSWNELAEALFAAVGKTPHIDYIPMPESIRPKYQYFTQADMSKLRKAGFTQPFSTLSEAVRDYTSYLKDHSYL